MENFPDGYIGLGNKGAKVSLLNDKMTKLFLPKQRTKEKAKRQKVNRAVTCHGAKYPRVHKVGAHGE